MASEMTLLPRLALAALASGAAAGLLATLALYVGGLLLLGGWAWQGLTASTLLGGLAAGMAAGLVVAALPAFLAGAAMYALGRRFEAARRAPAWAAAGAGGGGLVWVAVATVLRARFAEPGLERFDGVLLAALLVGAGAALAFRAVARPEGRPCPPAIPPAGAGDSLVTVT